MPRRLSGRRGNWLSERFESARRLATRVDPEALGGIEDVVAYHPALACLGGQKTRFRAKLIPRCWMEAETGSRVWQQPSSFPQAGLDRSGPDSRRLARCSPSRGVERAIGEGFAPTGRFGLPAARARTGSAKAHRKWPLPPPCTASRTAPRRAHRPGTPTRRQPPGAGRQSRQ
jgi:hypothetical protein